MLEGHGHTLLIIRISIVRTKEDHLLMGYMAEAQGVKNRLNANTTISLYGKGKEVVS
jgi:hypothetical protein